MDSAQRRVRPKPNKACKSDTVVKDKKPYTRPWFEMYGHLQNITLGGSPGIGDSGSGGSRFPPP